METRERKSYLKAAEENNEIVVIAEKSYITSKRLPAVSLANAIENPGVARANAAVSVEKPEGDLEWARKVDGYV
jgi:peroxygenase